MKGIGVHVSYSWWLKIYLNLLFAFCVIFRTEPNPEKLSYWVAKGLKLKAVVVDVEEPPKVEEE